MAKKNRDKEILLLKKEVADRKAALKVTDGFRNKTNLILPFFGQRHNLNVISAGELMILLAQLLCYPANLKSIGIDEEIELGGFSIDDWIHDLKGRYDLLLRRKKEDELHVFEQRLNDLLSDDFKKEEEFENLVNQIKKK